MKQTQLFNPNVAHLGRIAALRERVAEARRAFPDFNVNAGDVAGPTPIFGHQFDEARALCDSEFDHPMTAREREIESMALYIDCNYDVWDAWVDWNIDRTDYTLVVILVGGHPLNFRNDDHLALHVIHSTVGHPTFQCQCDRCTAPVPGQEAF